MRPRLASALLASAVLVPAAAPHGGLTPVPAPGLAGLAERFSIAVSPDGASVYAGGGYDNRSSIVAFRRDRRTGALTRIGGRGGCVLSWIARSQFRACAPAAINQPFGLAVTPDGRDVVAASWNAAPVTDYRRAPSGELRVGTCYGPDRRCRPLRGITHGVELGVSPDGRNVYVAGGEPERAVLVLRRDPRTGALAQLAGGDGCIQRAAVKQPQSPPCATVESPNFTPRGFGFSPDGRTVYVTSYTQNEGGGIFAFDRDQATGALTPNGCGSARPRGVCDPLPLLGAGVLAGDLPVARDGSLYVAFATDENDDGVVAQVRRAPDGTFAVASCVTGAKRSATCAPGIRGLTIAHEPTLSADGRTLYVGTESGVVAFARAADGSLKQLRGTAGCVSNRPLAGCTRFSADEGLGDLAATRDGRSLYAVGGRVFVFETR